MTFRPVPVVAIWTAGNLVLAALMFIFRENPIFIAMYFVATIPMFLGALVVRGVERRHGADPPAEYRTGQRSGLTLPLAVGVTAIGLGFIYGRGLILIGVLVSLITIVNAFSRPVTEPAGEGDEVLPHPVAATRPEVDRRAARFLERVIVVGLTALRRRRLTRGRSR